MASKTMSVNKASVTALNFLTIFVATFMILMLMLIVAGVMRGTGDIGPVLGFYSAFYILVPLSAMTFLASAFYLKNNGNNK
jgi:hypothetical protein